MGSSAIAPSAAVRRFDIRRRPRRDPMAIASQRDFRFLDGDDVASGVLAEDGVTLYCLDARRREAVFVETDPQIDLTVFPFFYQAQYQHARRAIVAPLNVVHAAADEIGDRFERAVIIYSVGRCGSTLLSKMFGRLEQCVSLSEPDVFTQLLLDDLSGDALVPLLRSATRLYFPPEARATHLVLKFRSFCIELAEAMQQAVPRAVPLFMYRNLEDVIRSGMQVYRYPGGPLWWIDRMHRWVVARPALAASMLWNRRLVTRAVPLAGRFTSWELARLGPVGLLAMGWVSAMERYMELHRNGMPLVALRYEDLTARAETTAAELLERCDLDPSLASRMLATANDDAQLGSALERRRQQRYELTAADRDVMRRVLSRSDTIDSGEFHVPGTIGTATA